MQMMKLRALQPFPFGKNRLAAGDMFDVEEKFGRVLVKVGRAQEVNTETPANVEFEAPVARATKVEPSTEEEVEAKPAAPLYRTRHMEAEKPFVQSSETPAPKKRGRPAGKGKLSQS